MRAGRTTTVRRQVRAKWQQELEQEDGAHMGSETKLSGLKSVTSRLEEELDALEEGLNSTPPLPPSISASVHQQTITSFMQQSRDPPPPPPPQSNALFAELKATYESKLLQVQQARDELYHKCEAESNRAAALASEVTTIRQHSQSTTFLQQQQQKELELVQQQLHQHQQQLASTEQQLRAAREAAATTTTKVTAPSPSPNLEERLFLDELHSWKKKIQRIYNKLHSWTERQKNEVTHDTWTHSTAKVWHAAETPDDVDVEDVLSIIHNLNTVSSAHTRHLHDNYNSALDTIKAHEHVVEQQQLELDRINQQLVRVHEALHPFTHSTSDPSVHRSPRKSTVPPPFPPRTAIGTKPHTHNKRDAQRLAELTKQTTVHISGLWECVSALAAKQDTIEQDKRATEGWLKAIQGIVHHGTPHIRQRYNNTELTMGGSGSSDNPVQKDIDYGQWMACAPKNSLPHKVIKECAQLVGGLHQLMHENDSTSQLLQQLLSWMDAVLTPAQHWKRLVDGVMEFNPSSMFNDTGIPTPRSEKTLSGDPAAGSGSHPSSTSVRSNSPRITSQRTETTTTAQTTTTTTTVLLNSPSPHSAPQHLSLPDIPSQWALTDHIDPTKSRSVARTCTNMKDRLTTFFDYIRQCIHARNNVSAEQSTRATIITLVRTLLHEGEVQTNKTTTNELLKMLGNKITKLEKECGKYRRSHSQLKNMHTFINELFQHRLPSLTKAMDIGPALQHQGGLPALIAESPYGSTVNLTTPRGAGKASPVPSEVDVLDIMGLNMEDAWSELEHRITAFRSVLEAARRDADNEKRRRLDLDDRCKLLSRHLSHCALEMKPICNAMNLEELYFHGLPLPPGGRQSPTATTLSELREAVLKVISDRDAQVVECKSLEERNRKMLEKEHQLKEKMMKLEHYSLQISNAVLSVLNELQLVPDLHTLNASAPYKPPLKKKQGLPRSKTQPREDVQSSDDNYICYETVLEGLTEITKAITTGKQYETIASNMCETVSVALGAVDDYSCKLNNALSSNAHGHFMVQRDSSLPPVLSPSYMNHDHGGTTTTTGYTTALSLTTTTTTSGSSDGGSHPHNVLSYTQCSSLPPMYASPDWLNRLTAVLQYCTVNKVRSPAHGLAERLAECLETCKQERKKLCYFESCFVRLAHLFDNNTLVGEELHKHDNSTSTTTTTLNTSMMGINGYSIDDISNTIQKLIDQVSSLRSEVDCYEKLLQQERFNHQTEITVERERHAQLLNQERERFGKELRQEEEARLREVQKEREERDRDKQRSRELTEKDWQDRQHERDEGQREKEALDKECGRLREALRSEERRVDERDKRSMKLQEELEELSTLLNLERDKNESSHKRQESEMNDTTELYESYLEQIVHTLLGLERIGTEDWLTRVSDSSPDALGSPTFTLGLHDESMDTINSTTTDTNVHSLALQALKKVEQLKNDHFNAAHCVLNLQQQLGIHSEHISLLTDKLERMQVQVTDIASVVQSGLNEATLEAPLTLNGTKIVDYGETVLQSIYPVIQQHKNYLCNIYVDIYNVIQLYEDIMKAQKGLTPDDEDDTLDNSKLLGELEAADMSFCISQLINIVNTLQSQPPSPPIPKASKKSNMDELLIAPIMSILSHLTSLEVAKSYKEWPTSSTSLLDSVVFLDGFINSVIDHIGELRTELITQRSEASQLLITLQTTKDSLETLASTCDTGDGIVDNNSPTRSDHDFNTPTAPANASPSSSANAGAIGSNLECTINKIKVSWGYQQQRLHLLQKELALYETDICKCKQDVLLLIDKLEREPDTADISGLSDPPPRPPTIYDNIDELEMNISIRNKSMQRLTHNNNGSLLDDDSVTGSGSIDTSTQAEGTQGLKELLSIVSLCIDEQHYVFASAVNIARRLKRQVKALEEEGKPELLRLEKKLSGVVERTHELRNQLTERELHLSVVSEGKKQVQQLLQLTKEKATKDIHELEEQVKDRSHLWEQNRHLKEQVDALQSTLALTRNRIYEFNKKNSANIAVPTMPPPPVSVFSSSLNTALAPTSINNSSIVVSSPGGGRNTTNTTGMPTNNNNAITITDTKTSVMRSVDDSSTSNTTTTTRTYDERLYVTNMNLRGPIMTEFALNTVAGAPPPFTPSPQKSSSSSINNNTTSLTNSSGRSSGGTSSVRARSTTALSTKDSYAHGQPVALSPNSTHQHGGGRRRASMPVSGLVISSLKPKPETMSMVEPTTTPPSSK